MKKDIINLNYEDLFNYIARLNINISFRDNINGSFVIAQIDSYKFHAESLDGPCEVDAMKRAIKSAIIDYLECNS